MNNRILFFFVTLFFIFKISVAGEVLPANMSTVKAEEIKQYSDLTQCTIIAIDDMYNRISFKDKEKEKIQLKLFMPTWAIGFQTHLDEENSKVILDFFNQRYPKTKFWIDSKLLAFDRESKEYAQLLQYPFLSINVHFFEKETLLSAVFVRNRDFDKEDSNYVFKLQKDENSWKIIKTFIPPLPDNLE